MIAAMAIGSTVGAVYYLAATRMYASKAALLVSYTGRDKFDTSLTDQESLRQNTMPTFAGMVRSAKVLAGAIRSLAAEYRVDLADWPEENWVDVMRANLSVHAIRATSILEISYASRIRRGGQCGARSFNRISTSWIKFTGERRARSVGC